MEEPHNSLTPESTVPTENKTSSDLLAPTCGENRGSAIKCGDSATSEIASSAYEMNASIGVLENQIKSEVDDSTLLLSTQHGLQANPSIDMDKVHQQHFIGPNNVASNMAMMNMMDESGDKTQSNMISNWINRLPQHLRAIAAQNPAAFLQQISAAAANNNNNNTNNFAQTPCREIIDSVPLASGQDETVSCGTGSASSGMNNQINIQLRQQQQLQAAFLQQQQQMSQSNNQFQQQQHLMMNFASGMPNLTSDLRTANMSQSAGMGNIPMSITQQQQQNVMNNIRMAMNNSNSLSASQFLPNDLSNSVVNPISASTDSSDAPNLGENLSSVGDSNDQIEKHALMLKNELNQIVLQINQLKTSTNQQDREIMNVYLNRYNYICRTLTQLRESTNPQSPSLNPAFGAISNTTNNILSQSQMNNQLLAQQILVNRMQQSQLQNNRISSSNSPPINSPQQQQAAALQRQMMANSTNLRIGNQFPGIGGVPPQPGIPTQSKMFGSFQNPVPNGPQTSVGTVPLPGGGQLTLPLTTIQQLQMMPPSQQQQCLIRLAAANMQPQGMMHNFQHQMANSLRFPPGSNIPGMQNASAASYRQNLALGNANYGAINMNALSRMPGQFPMNTHPNMAAPMHQINPRMTQYNTAHFQPGITKDMMIQAAMQGKIPLSHGASMRGQPGLGLSSRRPQKQPNNRRRRRQDSESEEDEDDEDEDISSSSQELTPTSEMLAAAVVAEGGLRRSSRARKQRTNYQAESDLLFSDDEDEHYKQSGTHSAGPRSKDTDDGVDEEQNSDSVAGNFNSSDLVAFQPIESSDGRVAIIETIFSDRIRNISDESDEDDIEKPKEKQLHASESKDFGEEIAKKSTRTDSTKQEKIDIARGTTTERETVEEFYVKYKYFSHLHCEWASLDQLKQKDPKAAAKVKKYKFKKNELNTNSFLNDDYFNPDYLEIDRILAVTTTVDKSVPPAENEDEEHAQDNVVVKPEIKSDDSQSSTSTVGNILTHYLVKWCSLPYEESTWELEEVVDDEKIMEFKRNQQMPPLEMCNMKCRPRPHEWSLLTESPKYKNGNTLRDYQLDGLNWLRDCYYNMRNCILADEMGLGKTIQSISLLNDVFQYGIRGPFLIIAPLSTIANWYREFQKWTDMNAIVFHGSAMSRELIVRYEMFYPGTTNHINISELLSTASDKSSRSLLPPVGLKLPQPRIYKFHALITTYEIMLSENRFLSTIPWRVAIVDEAHRLKNRNAKSLEGLFQMTMEHRVLLTGTPLQNSVQELFSLLSFLDPNRMPDTDILMNELSQVDSNQQVARLQQILKPIMLRRLKEDVEKNIAPKEETIIEVEMTAVQRKVYRGILERDLSFLMKGSVGSNVPNLMNTMMELRKCCNHPFLINGCEDKILAEFPVVTQEEFLETFWTSQSIVPITAVTPLQQGVDDCGFTDKETNDGSVVRSSSMSHYPAKVEDIEHIQDSSGRQLTPTHLLALIQSSGKLVLVDKLLPKLLRNGHKVLIFSQMVRVLNLLEDYLVARRFNYERIDGSVRGNLRQAAIDRFSKPGSDRFVFLLCTKAGGLGINLTAADTVIIFDSDWNPQNDLQAQARCHRIGQHKAVKVYRLICRNTYEREMFDRASLKLGLDKAVLQNINNSMSSENPQVGATSNRAQLSKKDVEDLLKRGAYGALMDEDVDSSAQFCAEDIDQILERRSTVVRIVGEGQGSTFAKASFTAESGTSAELNLDDPDFWKKWARKANVSADDEKNMDADALLFNDTPRIRRTTSGYARDNLDNLSDEEDDSSAGFYRGYRGGSYVRRSRRGNASNCGADDDAYSAEEDDDEDFSDSDLSDDNSRFHITTVSRNAKRTSWIRAECHKVERNLLIYGWGRWRDIYRACRFKTMVCLRDIIIISKAILVYCWHTSTKLDPAQKVFVEKIMEVAENYSYLYKNDISVSEEPLTYVNSSSANPGSSRKRRSKASYVVNSGKRSRKVKNTKGARKRGPTPSNKRNAPTTALTPEESCVVAFSAENWKEIDCNEFVTDASFRKRLKTNANKIIMRLRLLYLLESEIFRGQSKNIMKNVFYTDITLTRPNSIPSWFNENLTSWWHEDCDKSLLMGVVKHGYQNYAEIRNDKSLVFVSLLPDSSHQNSTDKESSKPSGLTSNSEDAPIVRPTRGRKKKSVSTSNADESPSDNCDSSTGVSKSKSAIVLASWPNSSDLNTRVRRLVNYFYKLSVRKATKATKPASGLKPRIKQSSVSNAHFENISNNMPEPLKELLDSFVECVRMFGFVGGNDGVFSWTPFISVARSNCPEFDIGFQKLQEILQFQDIQSSDEKIQKFLDNAARSLIFSVFSLSASSSDDETNYFSSLTPEIKDSVRERVEMFYYLRHDLIPVINNEISIESSSETHLTFEETLKKHPEFCFDSSVAPSPPWWSEATQQSPQVIRNFQTDVLRSISSYGLYQSIQSMLLSDSSYCFKSVFQFRHSHPDFDENGVSIFDPKSIPVPWFSPEAVTKTIHNLYLNLYPEMSILDAYSVNKNSYVHPSKLLSSRSSTSKRPYPSSNSDVDQESSQDDLVSSKRRLLHSSLPQSSNTYHDVSDIEKPNVKFDEKAEDIERMSCMIDQSVGSSTLNYDEDADENLLNDRDDPEMYEEDEDLIEDDEEELEDEFHEDEDEDKNDDPEDEDEEGD